MDYQLYDIDPVLCPFVSIICSIEHSSPVLGALPVRVLPDTCVELFVNLTKPQQMAWSTGNVPSPSRCFITSRMNRFMDIQSKTDVAFVSVCFCGSLAYRFFPVSMHDVANEVVDLRDLWGDQADEMMDRVDNASTMTARVKLIQQYLMQQLQQSATYDLGVDFCVRQIEQANGQLSLEELANQAGISNRQLVRRFNQYVGLSPKEFARMVTFKNALNYLKKHPACSLTEVAYEGGYYDQAHFIRTCRDYSGLTPGQLVERNNVLYCWID
ncbi:helix-turn-helix domain-containing protein [Spirosoma daeguense]